jgi:hypothetical protein
MQYENQSYIVSGQGGFKLSEALKLWKAKYPEFIDFKKDIITHPSLEDFGNFVEEYWDSIAPVTVEEALRISNTETRRTYFDCIGVQKLFKSLNPKLLDKQIITKKRANWDDENKEVFRTFEDVYELYEIEGKKLFEKDRWNRDANPVYAVRCWCTTTNREYWLYVNQEAATGQRWWGDDKKNYDAIRAIAWTILIDTDENNIEKMYRQGDIIVVKLKKETSPGASRHLSKEGYLSLMYSET